jgi:hypothetical protein
MSETTPTVLHRRKRALDEAAYRRGALDSDFATLVTEPTLLYDEDEQAVTIAYVPLPAEEDTAALERVLRRLDIRRSQRLGGLLSRSRTFGYHPRNAVRFNFCGPASLAADDAAAHALITRAAAVVARAYAAANPALYARHVALAQGVRRAWRLMGTPFTSGIVNRDNPLAYHFDAGNFRGVWSAMLGFKHDVTGGALVVPAYDVGFAIADRSLLLFDGQGLLHGVTPFRRTSPHGYRFTIVYYSLDAMWRCLPPGEEAKRPRHG